MGRIWQHQFANLLAENARRCCAGIVNCGKQIIAQEGAKSLWKGLTPFATHLTLKYALRMGTNAFYQSLLRDQVGYQLWGMFSRTRMSWRE